MKLKELLAVLPQYTDYTVEGTAENSTTCCSSPSRLLEFDFAELDVVKMYDLASGMRIVVDGFVGVNVAPVSWNFTEGKFDFECRDSM